MISPSTICYALKMTYDFLRSEYLCERTECNRKRLEEFSDAIDEIDNLKFEIEGYERSEWTKFDPDDSRTFPTKTDGSIVLIHFKYAGLNIVECAKFNFSWWTSAHVTHWRPLPKPPTETEEAK